MTTAECGFKSITGGLSGQTQLVLRGPTIAVDIGFDPNFKPGVTVIPTPAVQGVGALVDTGATESCIDDALAQKLKLPAIDRRKIAGAGGAHDVTMYLAQIYIPSLGDLILGAFAGVDLVAGGQTHQAIIGRTFLQHLTMTYDGTTGSVTLTKKVVSSPSHGKGNGSALLPGLGGGPWKS